MYLAEFVHALQLPVTTEVEGTISARELVRQGNVNRFQIELLYSNGSVSHAWRGSDAERLLEEGISQSRLQNRSGGSAPLLLRDRHGGEYVEFRDSASTSVDDNPLAVLFADETSGADENPLAGLWPPTTPSAP